jgi:hypothetical protein
MGYDTIAMKSFKRMLSGFGLEQGSAFHKTKLLLQVYRDVVWAAKGRDEELRREAQCALGGDFGQAVAYFTEFASNETRDIFEERLSFSAETKWMIDMIDAAATKVQCYHKNGSLYYEILHKSYLAERDYSESELLEHLCLSRTSYYALRREAITLLSVALWGYALPQLRGVLGGRARFFLGDEPN